MDLYLQFGNGMMDHCKQLIKQWRSGTVILSPRDLTREQIEQFSDKIIDLGGSTLLDPQLYNPRADHHRLTRHDYWPQDYSTNAFNSNPFILGLLSKLKALNDAAHTEKYIIPGFICDRVSDDYFNYQDLMINMASAIFADKDRLATICLSSDVLRFEEQIELILNRSESWDVNGYYLVAEHPNRDYLVEDPLWLTNLLILASGLKLQGRSVIVGYSNHQMLCLAAANVDAMASGTWLNVRSFPPAKFRQTADDETSRRVKWYYCPQSLSEYKLAFLDMGFRAGVMDQLRPDPALGSTYADILFSGAQPSSTEYGERDSFRHYLHCLHEQANQARRQSFNETVDAHILQLETADRLISLLHKSGVRGQNRDFAKVMDVNRVAVSALELARGFVLDRIW